MKLQLYCMSSGCGGTLRVFIQYVNDAARGIPHHGTNSYGTEPYYHVRNLG